MSTFWGEVLARWPGVFETFVKKWKFWLGVLGVPAALIAARWRFPLDQYQSLWWVAAVPLILSAIYAFVRAIYEQYAALESRCIAATDELAAQKSAQEGTQLAASQHRWQLIKELNAMQAEGITLRNLLVRKWPDDGHDNFKKWNRQVTAALKAKAPQYENQFVLVRPGIKGAYEGPRQKSADVNQMEDMLAQLQDIIADLRRQAIT